LPRVTTRLVKCRTNGDITCHAAGAVDCGKTPDGGHHHGGCQTGRRSRSFVHEFRVPGPRRTTWVISDTLAETAPNLTWNDRIGAVCAISGGGRVTENCYARFATITQGARRVTVGGKCGYPIRPAAKVCSGGDDEQNTGGCQGVDNTVSVQDNGDITCTLAGAVDCEDTGTAGQRSRARTKTATFTIVVDESGTGARPNNVVIKRHAALNGANLTWTTGIWWLRYHRQRRHAKGLSCTFREALRKARRVGRWRQKCGDRYDRGEVAGGVTMNKHGSCQGVDNTVSVQGQR